MFRESLMAVTVLLSAPARASPAPQFGNGEMDLTELMNKFLSEYDGGKGNSNNFEQHQEDISYDPEPEYNQQQRHPEPEPHMYGEAPQYYRPPQPQQHNQYQQQQEYYNQPERPQQQSLFQQHQQQQYQQKAHHGGQRHQEEKTGPSPHSQEQSAKADTTDQSQRAGPALNSAAPEQKQVQKVESVKQEAEAQEEDVDPKLRDFTLIISKLLFQLSQL